MERLRQFTAKVSGSQALIRAITVSRMIGIEIDFGLERSVINLGTHANAESVSRLQCVDDMEIVRKSFGEILPRVHGRICADETVLPVSGYPFRIAPLKSRAIV